MLGYCPFPRWRLPLLTARRETKGNWRLGLPTKCPPPQATAWLERQWEMASALYPRMAAFTAMCLLSPCTSHHATCPIVCAVWAEKCAPKTLPFPLKPPYRFLKGNVPYLFPAAIVFFFKKTKPSQTTSQILKDTLGAVNTLKLSGCLSCAIAVGAGSA